MHIYIYIYTHSQRKVTYTGANRQTNFDGAFLLDSVYMQDRFVPGGDNFPEIWLMAVVADCFTTIAFAVNHAQHPHAHSLIYEHSPSRVHSPAPNTASHIYLPPSLNHSTTLRWSNKINTLTHPLTRSHSVTHTLSNTHSLTYSYTLSHTHSHTFTHSLTRVFTPHHYTPMGQQAQHPHAFTHTL